MAKHYVFAKDRKAAIASVCKFNKEEGYPRYIITSIHLTKKQLPSGDLKSWSFDEKIKKKK